MSAAEHPDDAPLAALFREVGRTGRMPDPDTWAASLHLTMAMPDGSRKPLGECTADDLDWWRRNHWAEHLAKWESES